MKPKKLFFLLAKLKLGISQNNHFLLQKVVKVFWLVARLNWVIIISALRFSAVFRTFFLFHHLLSLFQLISNAMYSVLQKKEIYNFKFKKLKINNFLLIFFKTQQCLYDMTLEITLLKSFCPRYVWRHFYRGHASAS